MNQLFPCEWGEHQPIGLDRDIHQLFSRERGDPVSSPSSRQAIDQKGNIKQVKISAGYCSECNIFFILESTYEYLKKKGTPLCRISSEKAYLKGTGNYNGMNLQAESILMQYGYTVSQEEGLSPSRRQKILAVLIDNEVLTKNDIIGYLDFFISQKKSNHIFEKAISKWLDDREFVAEYKMGSYKEYFINGIHYKY